MSPGNLRYDILPPKTTCSSKIERYKKFMCCWSAINKITFAFTFLLAWKKKLSNLCDFQVILYKALKIWNGEGWGVERKGKRWLLIKCARLRERKPYAEYVLYSLTIFILVRIKFLFFFQFLSKSIDVKSLNIVGK